MDNFKTIKPLEVSNVPSGSIVKDVLNFLGIYGDDKYLIPGDKLALPHLKPQHGFQLQEAIVLEIPDSEERDENIYGDMDVKISLTIHADKDQYNIGLPQGMKLLKKNLEKWIVVRSDYMKILSPEVKISTTSYHVVSVVFMCELWMMHDKLGDIISSPFLDTIWDKYMQNIVTEGVCYVKGKVPVSLCNTLRQEIDNLSNSTPLDYHPNSNDIVRDLVHPALYPCIKGVSKLKKGCKVPINTSEHEQDFWGRDYEDSKFQWLPTPFFISADGKCSIQEYINNLDRNKFPDLYRHLESLFDIFLPYFQEVWSYAKAMKFYKGEEDEDFDEDEGNDTDDTAEDNDIDLKKYFSKEPVCFKDQELQVIVKIVEYTLQAGQSYEGVWHAEGMSHENIVMTGIYFLDRDENISGGDLRYKRAFTVAERNKVFYSVPQTRPYIVDTFATDGLIPLGKFPTEEGYILVFPNCHIHKIAKMINNSPTLPASRRIIVFFVINPEKKIISTREVAPQQDTISLHNAKKYRLELMSERKYDKEKLNIRDIELCEH